MKAQCHMLRQHLADRTQSTQLNSDHGIYCSGWTHPVCDQISYTKHQIIRVARAWFFREQHWNSNSRVWNRGISSLNDCSTGDFHLTHRKSSNIVQRSLTHVANKKVFITFLYSDHQTQIYSQVFCPLIFQCIVRAIRRVATIWCRLYIVEYLYYILHALCLCQEVRARRVSVSASECACLHIVSCSWKLCNSIIHLTDSINKLRSLWEKHCWNKIY